MSEELHELHEHAEEAHHDPSLAPATLTMAILAVLVAAVSLVGHRTHTEEILLQNASTNQWAYYQAKNIRRHTYELFLDLLAVGSVRDVEAAGRVHDKYAKEVARYGEEQKEIEAEARKLEAETRVARSKADRFDLGEVFLEIALVVTSITLLTRRRPFWYLGIVFAAAGLAVAASGLLLH
jgi:LPS O-antigen subunit length determinant protein (WzzB/FepE family)